MTRPCRLCGSHGPRQIHIGVDAWDMKPVKDLEVAELMKGVSS